MPIYEYTCGKCTHEFEELVLGVEEIRCPRCDAARATKRMSSFATARAGASASARDTSPPAPDSCGTCGDPRGPGACAS